MNGEDSGSPYRLAVREENGAWSWTLLRDKTVAMSGDAPGFEDAVRRGHFAAGAHAAFGRISRRRF